MEKTLLYLRSRVLTLSITETCPFFSLYWLPVQSNATQRRLTICLMLRLCQKRKRWQFEQSYMILFVFWFSVWHMPRWRPQSYKGTGGRGAGKGNHWKFKAFFFFSRCNEDADDSIYSHIYSRVLYTGSHAVLLHRHKTLISCLPTF